MTGLITFEIAYLLHEQPQHFVQADQAMNDADAWYYAVLHAGVAGLIGLALSDLSSERLRQAAERAGVTQVSWQVRD